MTADPVMTIARLRELGVPEDHAFAVATMMLKRFKWDSQEAEVECRRFASRFLEKGDDDNAGVMRLAARLCLFYGSGR